MPMVRMGDELGLYKAFNERVPMTCRNSREVNVDERYLREWLSDKRLQII